MDHTKTWMLKLTFFICNSLLLTACVSGVWTGANLFYDRHNVYHSFSDYELYTIAHHALYQDNYFKCAECHIDLAVFNGDVLLAGHVETNDMREEAYKRVMVHPDYRRLFKKISIDPIRTHVTRDAWITSKIRSQIVADSEINPRSFKVVTADQIVYLMGDVLPDQAEWVVEIARNTSGVKRVVKLFQYYHLSDKA